MPDLASTLERLLAKPQTERRIGPFVLIRQLGRGGFAPVWLAKETFGGETLRAAAVKIFALDEHDASASRRIIAEASALCRVEHPNVVRFYSLAVDDDLGVLVTSSFISFRSLFLITAIVAMIVIGVYLSTNLRHSTAENPAPTPAFTSEGRESILPSGASQSAVVLEPPSSPTAARDKPSFVPPRSLPSQPLPTSPPSRQSAPLLSAPPIQATSGPPSRLASSASSPPKLVLPPARDW